MQLGLTNKGCPKLSYDGYDYRKGFQKANGDLTWRCLDRSCKAHMTTDKQAKNIVSEPNDHCHPAKAQAFDANGSAVNVVCSTPSISCREHISNYDSLTKGESNVNLSIVSFNDNEKGCGCFSMIEKLTIERNNLVVENLRLREQWCAAIDRSIVNDLRIMELTDRPTMKETSSQTLFECMGKKIITDDEGVIENCNKLPFGMDWKELHLLVEENTSMMDQIIMLGDELERAKGVLTRLEGMKKDFEPQTSGKYRLRPKREASIRIWSDSHGRGLNNLLREKLSTGTRCYSQVFSHIAPGAPLEIVMDEMLLKKEIDSTEPGDYVVLVGGSNGFDADGFSQDYVDRFTGKLMRIVNSYKNAKLILTTIPYRYDLKEDSMINVTIKRVNRVIRNIPVSFPDYSINIVNLWTYFRSLHTVHGLHLNKKGKLRLVEELFGIINSYSVTPADIDLLQPHSELSKVSCMDRGVQLDRSQSFSCGEASICDAGDFLEVSTQRLGIV